MPNNNDNISLEQATAADVDREPPNAEEIDKGAENEKTSLPKIGKKIAENISLQVFSLR